MTFLLIFLTCLFTILGALIVFVTKNNKKIINFSISMAFGVMCMLITLELIPESYELLSENFNNPLNIIIMLGFIILGILLLKVIDLFVPDHDVIEKNEEEISENLYHIGIVSSIALILHNIIEGMAIYGTITTNITMGLLMTIGVGLHNIPMGLVISSTLYQTNKSKKKTLISIILISLSTLIGGFIMMFMSNLITSLILGILLSITLGMLIYIVIFELFGEIKHNLNKTSILGIIIGITIFLLTILFD